MLSESMLRSEPQLAAEPPLRALANDELVALALLEAALRGDGQGLPLNGHVYGVWVNPRQVEVDEELVPAPVGVHGEAPWGPSARDQLLPELLELAEGVKADRHLASSAANERVPALIPDGARSLRFEDAGSAGGGAALARAAESLRRA
jgi:hypothetical protein